MATAQEQKAAQDAKAAEDAKAARQAEQAAQTARLVELEAEVQRLQEVEAERDELQAQVDAQAAKIAEPDLPDGYVYVVDAAGQPIPSNPFVPKEWLSEKHKHLLPDGAQKATKEQEATVKATLATLRGRPASAGLVGVTRS